MEFRILGALEVASDGVIRLGSPKQRATLAALLLEANQLVTVDRLIDMVWGEDPPRTAAHSIQIYVSELRRLFGAESGRLVTRSPGYVLRVDPEELDAGRFETAVREAGSLRASGDIRAATELLSNALALWSGPALADFTYSEFAQVAIQRLEEMHHFALEDWTEGRIELGEAHLAIPSLQASVVTAPLRDRTVGLLMKALYASGRQAEALAVYQRHRRTLAEEMGLEPSAELSRLEEQILLHELTIRTTAPGSLAPTNPYKGLRPFEESDAADFFGRDDSVRQLVARLEAGMRLVSVVGPSGSGKSSLVRAGLLPALASSRARPWRVAVMQPGSKPGRELDRALDSLMGQPGSLLVIDQAEELWSLAPEEERDPVLSRLVDLVSDPAGVAVVMTLRADFFDRPLAHPGLGPPFTESVVTLLPLEATELEAVIVKPADQVGVDVEPSLLAQLSAEMAQRRGSLPLLQYALTEMFDLRDHNTLTLDTYRQIGGMRGALAGRSEHAFGTLDPGRRIVAEQVLLRLAVPGPAEGSEYQRIRVRAADLVDLGYDPVDLGAVIEEFVSHRLLTIDRDSVTGDTTIEIAHEALIREWPRLSASLAEHRRDLTTLSALTQAAREWRQRDDDEEYLAWGNRLAFLEDFVGSTHLRLGALEVEYVERSQEQRRAITLAEAARVDREQHWRRRARRRTGALAAVLGVGSIAAAYFVSGWLTPESEFVLFVSRDPGAIEQQMIGGLGPALSAAGATGQVKEISFGVFDAANDLPVDGNWIGMGLVGVTHPCEVASHGRGMVALGYSARGCPGVSAVSFANSEGAFLAGAAAAMKTQTGGVGFLGGVHYPQIVEFEAGFKAGVAWVEPGVEVEARYLTEWPDFSGFNPVSRHLAEDAAANLFMNGNDVIFAAAGNAGWGALDAAYELSRSGDEHLWVIGVDQDQEAAVRNTPLQPRALDEWASHILTSMEIHWDLSVSESIVNQLSDSPIPYLYLAMADQAMSLSSSDDFNRAQDEVLDELAGQIIDGSIVVPSAFTDDQGRFHARLDGGLSFDLPNQWWIIDDTPFHLTSAPAGHSDSTMWVYREVTATAGASAGSQATTAQDMALGVADQASVVTPPAPVTSGDLPGYFMQVTCPEENPCAPLLSSVGAEIYPMPPGATDLLHFLDHPDGGVMLMVWRDEDGEDSSAFMDIAQRLVASLETGQD